MIDIACECRRNCARLRGLNKDEAQNKQLKSNLAKCNRINRNIFVIASQKYAGLLDVALFSVCETRNSSFHLHRKAEAFSHLFPRMRNMAVERPAGRTRRQGHNRGEEIDKKRLNL